MTYEEAAELAEKVHKRLGIKNVDVREEDAHIQLLMFVDSMLDRLERIEGAVQEINPGLNLIEIPEKEY